MFAKKGFAGSITKDIARGAGVTDGLTYHYFRSKEALLWAGVKMHNIAPPEWRRRYARGPTGAAGMRAEEETRMTSPLFWTIAAVAANGLLAGISFDTSLVKLPAWRRIGALAYAKFARGADLGNGIAVYAVTGIGAALLVIAATIAALLHHESAGRLLPLLLAAAASIGHSLVTARTAPLMLSLRSMPDDESFLGETLGRFERRQALRAALQIASFFLMIWALAVAR